MKRRRIPMRMCVSCGTMKSKIELTRVVRTPDGMIKIDAGGKVSGRGAYICVNSGCVALSKKRRILERHLLNPDNHKRKKKQEAAAAPETICVQNELDANARDNIDNNERTHGVRPQSIENEESIVCDRDNTDVGTHSVRPQSIENTNTGARDREQFESIYRALYELIEAVDKEQ